MRRQQGNGEALASAVEKVKPHHTIAGHTGHRIRGCYGNKRCDRGLLGEFVYDAIRENA